MYIFTARGFLSVTRVQGGGNKALKVQGMDKQTLARMFPGHTVMNDNLGQYPFTVLVPQPEFDKFMVKLGHDVDYKLLANMVNDARYRNLSSAVGKIMHIASENPDVPVAVPKILSGDQYELNFDEVGGD